VCQTSCPLNELLGQLEHPGLVEFIRHLLVYNPEERPTASSALNHPWLKSQLVEKLAIRLAKSAQPSDDDDSARIHIPGYESCSDCQCGSDSSLSSSPIHSPYQTPHSSPKSPSRHMEMLVHAKRERKQQNRPTSAINSDASTRHDYASSKSQLVDDNTAVGESGSSTRRKAEKNRGPGIPEDFRSAIQPTSSRSHDWRVRLVRFLSPTVGVGPSTMDSLSTQGTPSSYEPQMTDPRHQVDRWAGTDCRGVSSANAQSVGHRPPGSKVDQDAARTRAPSLDSGDTSLSGHASSSSSESPLPTPRSAEPSENRNTECAGSAESEMQIPCSPVAPPPKLQPFRRKSLHDRPTRSSMAGPP